MRDVPIYDAPTRLFHWLFAGFFTVAFAIANLVDDESARFSLHMLAGLCMVFVCCCGSCCRWSGPATPAPAISS